MKAAFKIYKEGVTDRWITILLPNNEYTIDNINRKISFYIYLGYKIKLV